MGKSSLLKAIQGLFPIDEGKVDWGKNVYLSYYEQENTGLHDEKTALDELWDRYPHMLEVEVRTVLGNVLIRGEDCYKLVSDLSGGEKAFVAGADIAAMSTMTVKEGREFGKFGNDIFRKLETLPIPTIAAVNGFALGGGNELAMSCDIRYCSDNAVFGQPEVGLGITPGFGGTQRLVRIVGTGKAKEMVFTGQNIKADEAYRIGLVNGVYPREELMPAVMKLAQKIASNAPIAVRNSKRAVMDGFLSDLDHAIAIEEQYFSECFETEDQREGMKAFLEKRKVEKFNNR